MSAGAYTQLLDLACGAFLLTAVLVLWRRELAAIIRLLVLQGVALAAIVTVLAADRSSVGLGAVAAVILVLRAGVLPSLARTVPIRQTRLTVNVPASLLAAAALTLLAFAISQPLVRLAPSQATQAVPAGVAVLLIGFLVLVTRRGSISQVTGFLLVDNGITAVAILTGTGVPLVVGLAAGLDVLFAVLVLQIRAARLPDTELDELRELRD